jgi:hypothetical protein
MSKRKKSENPLPNALGLELKRQRPADAARFDMFEDHGRDAALAFEKENERLLAFLRETISKYAAAGNGDGLLLLDCALLASCSAIRDYLARMPVAVVGQASKH